MLFSHLQIGSCYCCRTRHIEFFETFQNIKIFYLALNFGYPLPVLTDGESLGNSATGFVRGIFFLLDSLSTALFILISALCRITVCDLRCAQ